MTMSRSVIQIGEPLAYPPAPSKFSYSLLTTLRACPRKWQLAHATFPDWNGPYPRPYAKAAVLGQITHDVLQHLVGWLVKNGSPVRGSVEFARAMQSFELRNRIQALMDQQLALLAENPRARRVKALGFGFREVQNRVFQLLNMTWTGKTTGQAAPDDNGAKNLAEEWVDHPDLPLGGYLDLIEVRPDGDVITDYKTGELSDSYRHQILLYALLWWRRSGRLARLLRVVPAVGETLELSPSEAELESLENELKLELEQWSAQLTSPAEARVCESSCRFCHVRAHCTPYWEDPSANSVNSDLAGTVVKVRSSSSLTARIGDDCLEVTAGQTSGYDLSTLMAGDRVRLLSIVMAEDGSATLTQYSELYIVGQATPTSS